MAICFPYRLCVLLSLALAAALPASAAGLVSGGQVLDAADGRPLAGATVAVFDDRGEVVGTDNTDADGVWAVPVDWAHCHLKAPPGGKGLFSTVTGVVLWPFRIVSDIVVTPASSAIKGAIKAAGGAAAAGVGVAAAAGAGPVAAAAAGAAARTVGSYAAEQVVGDPDEDLEHNKMKPLQSSRGATGQVRVRVWKKGFQDYTGVTGVYLLSSIRMEEGRHVPLALTDAVQLARSGSGLTSSAPVRFGWFRRVEADPAVAPGGSRVRLSAEITLPREAAERAWVIARNLTTRKDYVMIHAGGDVWQADIDAPERGPFRNHEIAIVAYRSPLEDGGRDRGAEGRMDRQGAFDPKKPFPVDPALLLSRNRGYTVVTVTRPEKQR
ncbi:MAG: hypothetical protein KatS3mg024_2696 [Armatimonadota bacterium]|nr:MAG: hypothetical protein KatS3mg024_2696 [Armatimonadota bacterium]